MNKPTKLTENEKVQSMIDWMGIQLPLNLSTLSDETFSTIEKALCNYGHFLDQKIIYKEVTDDD